MAYSKRKQSTIKASLSRSKFHRSSGSRKIDIVLPATKPLDGPPMHDKRQSQIPRIYHPPEFKKTKWKKKSPGEKKHLSLLEMKKKVKTLEKKWYAAFCYGRHQKEDGTVSPRIGRMLVAQHGYSLKQIRLFIQKANNGESLWRKSGSGRKKTTFDIANRCLQEIFREYGGELSQLTMTELVNRKGVKVWF